MQASRRVLGSFGRNDDEPLDQVRRRDVAGQLVTPELPPAQGAEGRVGGDHFRQRRGVDVAHLGTPTVAATGMAADGPAAGNADDEVSLDEVVGSNDVEREDVAGDVGSAEEPESPAVCRGFLGEVAGQLAPGVPVPADDAVLPEQRADRPGVVAARPADESPVLGAIQISASRSRIRWSRSSCCYAARSSHQVSNSSVTWIFHIDQKP